MLQAKCGCEVGLLPMGCVWLGQNVPINLLSCFSVVSDSYGIDGPYILLQGKGYGCSSGGNLL